MAKPPSMYAIFKNYGAQETFTCDGCKKVLTKAWSDEKAIEEMHSVFPDVETSDVLVLCDDCVEVFNLKPSFDVGS